MPKVSGLIVPKLCHRHPDGNIRCLEPMAPSANHHAYSWGEHEEPQDEEEPKEPLSIVTEVATIIFLVSLTDFFPFIGKHGIYLTDMHLCGHPLAFFGKQFLDFCQSASLTFTDTFNFVGAFSKTLSMCWLMVSTFLPIVVTAPPNLASARWYCWTASLHERHSLLSLYYYPLESEPH